MGTYTVLRATLIEWPVDAAGAVIAYQ